MMSSLEVLYAGQQLSGFVGLCICLTEPTRVCIFILAAFCAGAAVAAAAGAEVGAEIGAGARMIAGMRGTGRAAAAANISVGAAHGRTLGDVLHHHQGFMGYLSVPLGSSHARLTFVNKFLHN